MDLENLTSNGDVSEIKHVDGCPETESEVDPERIHISPIPKFFGFKQFKKFLNKHLSGMDIRKIRQMKFDAYVSFNSSEDAQTAIAKLNGLEVKKIVLSAKLAQTEKRKLLTNPPPMKPKTARESVTKFAGMSYNEQLTQKQRASHRLCERLLNEMGKANVTGVSRLRPSGIVKKIRPSPKIRKYRNKCEFTIGRTQEGTVRFFSRSQSNFHVFEVLN
ncbi:hypothetical protein KIN20_036702 [Parelaphostrongylus tenuis]|uniref:RRM domain-containing protein n=1 Tax=Parelaphostrongylus tenuis TaxID=148309 RepID=A0AAD5WKM9_PARTN|nr:hypothetical protein KIN20_036702 [Parelaphostrongylus tenuis]